MFVLRSICPLGVALVETDPYVLPPLDDLIGNLTSLSEDSRHRECVKSLEKSDGDGGTLKELWLNCFQRIQHLRVGLWGQRRMSAAMAKAEVQRSVLRGCVICLGELEKIGYWKY